MYATFAYPLLPEFPPGYFTSKTDLIFNLLKSYLSDCIIYPQVKIVDCRGYVKWTFSLKKRDGGRGYCYAGYWLMSKRLEFFYSIDNKRIEIDTLHLDADL